MRKCELALLAIIFASGASALAKDFEEYSQSELRQALVGQPRCYLFAKNDSARSSGKHMRVIIATKNHAKLYFAESEQHGEYNITYLPRVGLIQDGYVLKAKGGVSSPKILATVYLPDRGRPTTLVKLSSVTWYGGEENYSGSCYSMTAFLE